MSRLAADRRRSTLAVAAGVLTAAVCLSAAVPYQRAWRRVDSPNFVIVGDISEGRLLNTAIRFEAFRTVLARVLPPAVMSTPVPTVVIVFPNDRSFTPLKPVFNGRPVDAAGLFAPGQDINYIVIVDDERPERMRVVFHEYAHLILANLGRDVPAWLNEGLAEFYSTFELGRGGREATIGMAIDGHLEVLNDVPPLTIEQLLTVDRDSPLYNEGDRRTVFYAQSWALTHMIMLGTPNRTEQLDRYLALLSRGAPAIDAWRQAFGDQNMAGALLEYIRHQAFRAYVYTFEQGLGSFDAPVSTVPPPETQAVLVDFLIRRNRLEEAEGRLADAMRLDPENPRLRLNQVMLDLARDRYDEAERALSELPTPDDWLLSYLAGVAVSNLSERRGGWANPQHVDQAARFFGASRTARPELANAMARRASLDVRTAGGPTTATREAIERARNLAPGRHDYALIHAQVLARLLELDAARAVLAPLTAGPYPVQVRDAASRLMASVVELQNAAAAPDAAPAHPAPTDATVRFREVQPGETRTEGLLVQIDCGADGSVRFHLRTGEAEATAAAPAIRDVTLIAYRDDVQGKIGCGPLTTPLPAFLTWRPADDGSGEKIAVALEILPKG